MFKWIVCARRPLTVDEIRETIAFSMEDTSWDKDKIPTDISRLARSCGNFIIIDQETKVVRLAHYTIQQYLLREYEDQENSFNFTLQEANIMAGETCVAYLSFSDFETQTTRYSINPHTDVAAMTKAALKSPLIAPDSFGESVIKIWSASRPERSRPRDIDYTRHLPRPVQAKQDLTQIYALLGYITANWLWHTLDFDREQTLHESKTKRVTLFRAVILDKSLLFDYTPWGSLKCDEHETAFVFLIGWAIMANHALLLRIIDEEPYLGVGYYIAKAVNFFFRDFDKSYVLSNGQNSFRISQFSLLALHSSSPDSLEPEIDANILDMSHPMFTTSGSTDSFHLAGSSDIHTYIFPKYPCQFATQTPALGWLYSRLLIGCQRGDIESQKSREDTPQAFYRGHISRNNETLFKPYALGGCGFR